MGQFDEGLARLQEEIDLHDFRALFAETQCLHPFSKVLRGELSRAEEETQKCGKPECVTVKRVQEFRFEVVGGPCDGPGPDVVSYMSGELLSAYIGDPTGRGTHGGYFKITNGIEAEGLLHGTTNSGTHHDPLRDCEKCDQPGHLEGIFRGITRGEGEPCFVFGSYAFDLDPIGGGPEAAVAGTMEGVIACDCRA